MKKAAKIMCFTLSFVFVLTAVTMALAAKTAIEAYKPQPPPPPTYILTQSGPFAYQRGDSSASGITGNDFGGFTQTGISAIMDSESAKTHSGLGFGKGSYSYSGMGAFNAVGAKFSTGSGLAAIVKKIDKPV